MTFGKGFELFTTLLLFVFLLFVIVAYMVLVRTIWAPIFQQFIFSTVSALLIKWGDNDNDSKGSDRASFFPLQHEKSTANLVLFVLIVLMTPFLLRKDLHALRYNCYIGFASITILCLAIVYRAYQKCEDIKNIETETIGTDESNDDPLLWLTNDPADVLFSFPIIMLSLLCSFNVVPVQAALIRPTQARVRYIINLSITGCTLLTYTFGLFGYLFARSRTEGNILQNFIVGDNLILLGRVGSGVTTLMALPMMIVPCRQAILEFIPNFVNYWVTRRQSQTLLNEDTFLEKIDLEEINENSRLISKSHCADGALHVEDVLIPKESSQASYINTLIHITSTLIIVSVCFILAVSVPGVAIVWSICGSSMGFLIGFIIPCACYIQIYQFEEKIKWHTPGILATWIVLIVSILVTIACTAQTIWSLVNSTAG